MLFLSRVLIPTFLLCSSLFAQTQGAVSLVAKSVHSDSVAAALTIHLPEISDSILQAKLDSLSAITETVKPGKSLDSAQIKDSTSRLRAAAKQGKYIDRTTYEN